VIPTGEYDEQRPGRRGANRVQERCGGFEIPKRRLQAAGVLFNDEVMKDYGVLELGASEEVLSLA
jgi:hypothetical protein